MEDVRRVLGVFEKATELREIGLSYAHVARELGFTDGMMIERLLGHAEEVARTGNVLSAEAEELLAHYGALAEEWVFVIFSDVPEEPEPDVARLDPDSVLLPDGA